MAVPRHIVCVDCGGTCHLLTHPDPEVGFVEGDVVAYRCGDCLDRWDVEVGPDEAGHLEDPAPRRRRIRGRPRSD